MVKFRGLFDIKLSLDENTAKLDISKSMRFVLIYLCGGLELEGIAYSVCVLLLQKLKEALYFLSQKQNKRVSIAMDSGFVQAQFAEFKDLSL